MQRTTAFSRLRHGGQSRWSRSTLPGELVSKLSGHAELEQIHPGRGAGTGRLVGPPSAGVEAGVAGASGGAEVVPHPASGPSSSAARTSGRTGHTRATRMRTLLGTAAWAAYPPHSDPSRAAHASRAGAVTVTGHAALVLPRATASSRPPRA